MKRKRMKRADADALGIRLEDIADDLGPFGRALVEGLKRRARILVWCHSCGCSFDWPWGRCIYRCERCGSGRMSALDPGGERGELAS